MTSERYHKYFLKHEDSVGQTESNVHPYVLTRVSEKFIIGCRQMQE